MSDPSSCSTGPVGRYYIPVHDAPPDQSHQGLDRTLVTLLFLVVAVIVVLASLFPMTFLVAVLLAALAVGGRAIWCLRSRR